MSIIDFNMTITKPCDRPFEEIQKELYLKYKDSLKFHIGDKVKLDITNEDIKKSFNDGRLKEESYKDKIFNIIDSWMNFDNNWNFVIDTNENIKIFPEKYLIKVE